MALCRQQLDVICRLEVRGAPAYKGDREHTDTRIRHAPGSMQIEACRYNGLHTQAPMSASGAIPCTRGKCVMQIRSRDREVAPHQEIRTNGLGRRAEQIVADPMGMCIQLVGSRHKWSMPIQEGAHGCNGNAQILGSKADSRGACRCSSWVRAVLNGRRGGSGPLLLHQKWPDKIFPIANFFFSHYSHFGLEGEGSREPSSLRKKNSAQACAGSLVLSTRV